MRQFKVCDSVSPTDDTTMVGHILFVDGDGVSLVHFPGWDIGHNGGGFGGFTLPSHYEKNCCRWLSDYKMIKVPDTVDPYLSGYLDAMIEAAMYAYIYMIENENVWCISSDIVYEQYCMANLIYGIVK